jgi:hypothetical protein
MGRQPRMLTRAPPVRLKTLLRYSMLQKKSRLLSQGCSSRQPEMKLNLELQLWWLLPKLLLMERNLKQQQERWRKMTRRSELVSLGSLPCCLKGSAPLPTRRKIKLISLGSLPCCLKGSAPLPTRRKIKLIQTRCGIRLL